MLAAELCLAETFVFSIAAKLLGELVSPAFQEACLVWGVESNLKRLEKTLSNVKVVLLDVEDQQFHNHELTDWLGQLKEVFYDAQDVLDEFKCEALRRQVVEMQGAPPGRYAVSFLPLIHLYSEPKCLKKSKKLEHV